MKLAGFFALGISLALIGCGKPGRGDDCEQVNTADECEEGLVCGESGGEKPVCQTQCFTSADCPSNFDCVAATGAENGSAPLACRAR